MGGHCQAISGTVGSVSDPIVTLVTAAAFPELDSDEAGLPDALRERGIEPRIAVWNDPSVDWSNAGTVVVRSVRDYAPNRLEFIEWAKSVPRLLNPASVIEWNTDKHYLKELAKRGMPTIDTMWLEPSQNLSRHQVHTRMPAYGDFVIKPAISSGGRGTGRYTSTDGTSRMNAISDAIHHLEKGRTVMVQRYHQEVDHSGEISLIYLNGLPSYMVKKEPMLHPRFRGGNTVQEEIAHSKQATEDGSPRRASASARPSTAISRTPPGATSSSSSSIASTSSAAVRTMRKSSTSWRSHDASMARCTSSADESNLEKFADAIAVRAFW